MHFALTIVGCLTWLCLVRSGVTSGAEQGRQSYGTGAERARGGRPLGRLGTGIRTLSPRPGNSPSSTMMAMLWLLPGRAPFAHLHLSNLHTHKTDSQAGGEHRASNRTHRIQNQHIRVHSFATSQSQQSPGETNSRKSFPRQKRRAQGLSQSPGTQSVLLPAFCPVPTKGSGLRSDGIP